MRPLLWHIPISHYSEKVRWALDYKRVPHRRRVAAPGLHPLFALGLTRGRSYTAPLLEVDGQVIGDSTEIVAELERRWPERPLYPVSDADRRRALELEDWFDEEVGPAVRLWAFYELTSEPESLAEVTAKQAESMPGQMPERVMQAVTVRFVGTRYGVGAERAAEARAKVIAGLDRLEAELSRGGGQYLVGDGFTVADLTAASLFYPLVLPPEGPWRPQSQPQAVREMVAEVGERPGFKWVEEIWRRHRGAAAATV